MLNIQIFPLGPLETNSYLIYNHTEALAVDVGGDPAPILDFLQKNKLKLSAILLTHLHFDHTYGVQRLAQSTGAKVFASKKDEYMLQSELGLGGKWGLPAVEQYSFEDLQEGNQTYLGTTCQVLATPGHTPGGLSFYFPEASIVIVGDTLFHRSVGRTDFPRGDLETLMLSIHKKLFTLPAATTVYAGHGEPTNIGEEKLGNPFTGEFTF